MNTNTPGSDGMWGYYDHATDRWWVRDGSGFRKAATPVRAWHEVKLTTPTDTEKDVLFCNGDVRWVDDWAGRSKATHWTELPDPPVPEFKIGGVYRIPLLSGVTGRITAITVLNGKKYLFGVLEPGDPAPCVWDETGHALPFAPHDKLCDLALS